MTKSLSVDLLLAGGALLATLLGVSSSIGPEVADGSLAASGSKLPWLLLGGGAISIAGLLGLVRTARSSR